MSKPDVILCEDFRQTTLPLSRVTKRVAAKALAATRRKWGARAALVRREEDGALHPRVLVCGEAQERRDYVADRLLALAKFANKPTPIRDWLNGLKTTLYWAFIRMRTRWALWHTRKEEINATR